MAFNIQSPSIDPSILRAGPSLGGMMQKGLQGVEHGYKVKDMLHQRKFMEVLSQTIPNHDYTTPEGQKSLITELSQKGFGPEAMDLASKFPKPEIETKVPFDAGAAGVGTFGTKSGKFTPLTQPSKLDPTIKEPVISGVTQKEEAKDKAEKAKAEFEAKKYERSQSEIERNNKKQNEIALKNAEAAKLRGSEESKLPLDVKKQIEVLASKNAGKLAIANQLESDLVQMQKAMGLDESGKPIQGNTPNEDLAYSYAQNMLKTMNSKEGADAVGVDEARRAAGLLEYNIADLSAGLGFKPGKFHGRDIKGFMKQVKSNVEGTKGAINLNKSEIDKLYGRNNKPTSKFKILSVE